MWAVKSRSSNSPGVILTLIRRLIPPFGNQQSGITSILRLGPALKCFSKVYISSLSWV